MRFPKADNGVAREDPEKDGGPTKDSKIQERILKHSRDADEAMKAFADQEGVSLEIDEATNRRLLRKIDLNMMPIMCIVYGLNFLDKTSISYASITGLVTDIGLTGFQYNWLGSMFYFGYLGFEWPTNFLLQHLPIGKYSALNIILWGTTLTLFATVSNFSGAVAVRFFLGVFESAVTPGFALITSQWYTKEEQGARVGFWFSFNGWAQIFGGLVAYGIAKGSAKYGTALAPWKIIFLVVGLLTVTVGIIALIFLPNSQLNARFLNKKERILAVERIRRNQQGVGNKTWKAYQFKEALTDPLAWALFFYALVADIPNGGITNFFSILIQGFGYSATDSLLYGTPGGAVEVVTIVSWAILTLYYPNKRLVFASMSLALAIIGIILIIALPLSQKKSRLAGYYLTQASATPFVALLSLISSNIAGYTKKTTVAAMYLIGYCTGNIIGPQTFTPQSAPRYVPAEITILIMWSLSMATLYFILFYCKWQNKMKVKLRAQPGYQKLENQEFLDLTDGENPEFVYTT